MPCRGYVRFGCALCVLVIGAVAQGAYRLEPSEITFSIKANLFPFWNGFLDVNEITIRDSGEVVLRNAVLTDSVGRPWLFVPAAQLAFCIDANGGMSLSEVYIERPHLLVYLESEKVQIPFDLPMVGTTVQTFPRLNMITLHDGQLSIVTGTGELFVPGINGMLIARSGGYYEMRLSRFLPSRLSSAVFTSRLNLATQEFSCSLLGTHPVDINETGVFLDAFDFPVIRSFAGQLTANLHAKVCLKDPNTYWPDGFIRLYDAVAYTKAGRLVDEGGLALNIRGRTFDLEPITATGLGGSLQGALYVIADPGHSKFFGGHFVVRDIKLEELSRVLGDGYFKQGTGSLALDFTAHSRSLNNFRAQGAVFFDDADLWRVPIVSHIFSFLRIFPSRPIAYSDGIAEFRINGPVITFKTARISSPITAIDFQKDATVNLAQHWVDAYAVTFPIGSSLVNVPVVGRFIKFKNKLTRLHIYGDYLQPPEKLIRKNIGRDVSKASIEFFTGTAKTGGNIGRGAFENVTTVLKE